MGGTATKQLLPYTRVAARTASAVELKSGEKFAWCSCGYSSNQPYCDGAHKAVNIQNKGQPGFEPLLPIVFSPDEGEDLVLEACQCKQTSSPPFCDGSHNNTGPQHGPETITATDFLPFELLSNEKRSHDTVALRLRAKKSALPTLQEDGASIGPAFHFSARVTAKDGRVKTRPYTPVSYDPETGELELVVKRYEQGLVSPVLHELQPGAFLELRGPLQGSFSYWDTAASSLTLFGAGTGITPVLQLAHAVLGDPGSTAACRMYCSWKSAEDVLCAEEISELSTSSDQLDVWHVLEDGAPTGGHAGRISKQILKSTGLPPPADNDHAVVCGPPLFNRAVKEMLLEYGYSPKQITFC